MKKRLSDQRRINELLNEAMASLPIPGPLLPIYEPIGEPRLVLRVVEGGWILEAAEDD
jgi:hypothetical protein